MEGADLRATFDASCLRGALPPVDLRAVCLVRAIATDECDVVRLMDYVMVDGRHDGQMVVDGCGCEWVWMEMEMGVVSGRVGAGWGTDLNR